MLGLHTTNFRFAHKNNKPAPHQKSIITMKKALLSLCLWFAFVADWAYAQNNSQAVGFENIFRLEMPTRIDTLYYPFYGGVQMIEVDHIGFWDRKIFFLEQSQPRAMPHSAFHPMPIGNAYFLRDTAGQIVKAFNSNESLVALNQHFKKISLQKKSSGFGSMFPYHTYQPHREGVWYQSPQSRFDFPGHYKVSTGYAEQESRLAYSNHTASDTLKFGLIDTLGREVIPLEYQEIMPYYDLLLVKKEHKWGLITYENKVVVALHYDWYAFDRFKEGQEQPKKTNLFFLSIKETTVDRSEFVYEAIYIGKDNKLIPLHQYDKVQHEYAWRPAEKGSQRLTLIVKNGKTGLLGEDFQEVVPPVYEIFDYNRNGKGLFRVAKAGKFGFFDEHFRVKIAPEYDYAEAFQSDSTALVLKEGAFFRIDTKNKKQTSGMLNPRWETGQLSFVTNKNYLRVSTGVFMGLVDTSTWKMVLPFAYLRNLTPEKIISFCSINKGRFDANKFELGQKSEMDAEILFYQNKIIVKNSQQLYGVIDTSFQTLVDFKYEKLEAISSALNYLLYTQNGKQGAMDYTGKELLTGKYEEVRYDQHYEQERALFKVKQKGKWGVVDFTNHAILPCMYDSIKFLGHWNRPKEKLWVVEKGQKFGVVDEQNQTFIPFDYQGISHLEGNNLWVESKEKGRYKVVVDK
jgi:hypothetical protein